jgi:hypothetical protein
MNVRTQTPKLLDPMRQKIRVLHYSIRTEKTYVDWMRRFIFFMVSGIRHKWVALSRFLGSMQWEQGLDCAQHNAGTGLDVGDEVLTHSA